MWGQDFHNLKFDGTFRIIPMRVGTRCLTKPPTNTHQDHPHACGDKAHGDPENWLERGSSPCVWGQGVYVDINTGDVRIIPMRVGTSNYVYIHGAGRMDHPHACGDKAETMRYWSFFKGSSPCVWGQDTSDNSLHKRQRIIPMRVGTR